MIILLGLVDALHRNSRIWVVLEFVFLEWYIWITLTILCSDYFRHRMCANGAGSILAMFQGYAVLHLPSGHPQKIHSVEWGCAESSSAIGNRCFMSDSMPHALQKHCSKVLPIAPKHCSRSLLRRCQGGSEDRSQREGPAFSCMFCTPVRCRCSVSPCMAEYAMGGGRKRVRRKPHEWHLAQ